MCTSEIFFVATTDDKLNFGSKRRKFLNWLTVWILRIYCSVISFKMKIIQEWKNNQFKTRKIWHTLVFCSSGNSGSHSAFYGSQMAPFSKSILWLCRCVPYWLFSGSGYKIKQRKQTLIKMSHITQVVLSSNTWCHHQLWALSKFCIIAFFSKTLLFQAVFNSINSVWTFTCPNVSRL